MGKQPKDLLDGFVRSRRTEGCNDFSGSETGEKVKVFHDRTIQKNFRERNKVVKLQTSKGRWKIK